MATAVLLYLPPFTVRSPPSKRSEYRRIRCSNDRQELFSRIAPVYDNVRPPLSYSLFSSMLPYLLAAGIMLEFLFCNAYCCSGFLHVSSSFFHKVFLFFLFAA